ncbi:MAG TPA: hypothetical protein VGB61_13740 [Pyrinomonadaceae bacterium]|jgi:hypothetical protein
MNLVMGVFFTLFGLAMAIFHRSVGRAAGYFQREVMNVKFSKDEHAAIGYLVGGILFAAIGLLTLFAG